MSSIVPQRPAPLDEAAVRARSEAFLRALHAQGLSDEEIADESGTPITPADLAAMVREDGAVEWPR